MDENMKGEFLTHVSENNILTENIINQFYNKQNAQDFGKLISEIAEKFGVENEDDIEVFF